MGGGPFHFKGGDCVFYQVILHYLLCEEVVHIFIDKSHKHGIGEHGDILIISVFFRRVVFSPGECIALYHLRPRYVNQLKVEFRQEEAPPRLLPIQFLRCLEVGQVLMVGEDCHWVC